MTKVKQLSVPVTDFDVLDAKIVDSKVFAAPINTNLCEFGLVCGIGSPDRETLLGRLSRCPGDMVKPNRVITRVKSW